MRHTLLSIVLLFGLTALAETMPFGKGRLTVTTLNRNAVRIQYSETSATTDLPDWLYVKPTGPTTTTDGISVKVDGDRQTVTVSDSQGNEVFTADCHQMTGSEATLAFHSAADEFLFGLGQFQDGYTNVRGLSRRLTQVNTQISIPMLLSNKGYGVLWNNYGLVDFNPADQSVQLLPQREDSAAAGSDRVEVVDVTSTEGGRQEVRRRHVFEGTIDVGTAGDYSLLLDVGQTMARRHHLAIDGKTVIEMQNLWLPPTASAIIHLSAGRHTVTAELSHGDSPTLYYQAVTDKSVFRSPVATAVDYTVFVGTPDEIIASYRELTGTAPLMPRWALGYIHCRERFHSSAEILETANRFRREQLPVDVIVQDWQYWGKHGWNSMRFDEDYYPDPKALTDSLHKMDLRLMVSVWSKIDKNSEVGREMSAANNYIPGTDWIDFFNPDAAAAYWRNFSTRLLPLGIDAWWQDATEPENDDLAGRRVNNGRWAGEQVRNVYPLLVNKTVYEGLSADAKDALGRPLRPMILTRCGFPGIQRYGSALWSGDVGNDWETFRRQIAAGLGMQAAGIPWWTYDAGGFFRPGNQYTDKDYIERMLRWIETAVYLPLMRVHGYMSNTEPWNYGAEAQGVIASCLHERHRLLPYIYSHAARVSFNGSTLMRPLVFDFSGDATALAQRYEYMFGQSLLVSPVVEPKVTTWKTYLPQHAAGWYDYHTGRHYPGGQDVSTGIDGSRIPVFVRGGSIIPLAVAVPDEPSSASPLDIRIYPGADAVFTLYEDDGCTTEYRQGQSSRITFSWDDARRQLTIGKREGSYAGMPSTRTFNLQVMDGSEQKTVTYKGKRLACKLPTPSPTPHLTATPSAAVATSCNGKLAMAVTDSGYVVSYCQQPILELAAVGMEGLTPHSADLSLKYVGQVSADYTMLAGKRLHCTNQASEYRAELGPGMALVMRLYDDGIAYRYELTGLNGQPLPQERTVYRIAEGTRRWIQQWTDAYEGFFPLTTSYKTKPVRSFSAVSTSADGWNNRWGYPALIEPADGVFVLLSEANIERQQSASCLYSDGELYRVTPDDNPCTVSGDWHSPWRVAIIGTLADIVGSTLVTDVSEPAQTADTSWIHPGVVSWIYWAYNHGSNDYNIIKKYVDMAVTLKLPYVLIDAEWDTMKDGKTVEDAVAYAKAQGIRPMIWYNSSVGWVDGAPTPKYRLNKPEDREKEFAWCERIGVAGVKIDFFSGDNQRNMDYCLDLLESAARHHLLVNFHGATIPRGWQRTYPNLLTTEAVYGAEWYNNVPTFTKQAAAHNATLPYTRNVIGPMDYTPCTFSDSQHPHITSNGHELALTVLYESGLQHLADRPESYLSQPAPVQDFLSTLPAVWDETRFVCGYPGTSAVIARRSGGTWYVAGINGTDRELPLTVDLSFLGPGTRSAMVFTDPANSQDGKWLIGSTRLPRRASVTCQPRGGFVWVIK